MSTNKSTVLYIDDDPLNLEVFNEFFCEDYHIITLQSTQGAEKVIKENLTKVIISDQCMPEETGIDFINRINPLYPDILKIIFTAYSNYEMALEAINKVGIYKFLLKPWQYKEVKDTIDAAIREFDLRHENRELLISLKTKNDDLNKAFFSLQENETKFRTVFSKSNDCIYIINQKKDIIEANQAFCKMVGHEELCSNMELLNVTIKNKYPDLIYKPIELLMDKSGSIAEMDIVFTNGETHIFEINSNSITYNEKPYILSVTRDISERRMYEKKIVDAIIRTQEEDQSKYARELHDGIGPLLSALKMNIEWIADPENSVNKDKIINHSIIAINDAIRSVKEIANNLSPHILQRYGLVNAVNSYIDHLKESSTVEFIISTNLKERLCANTEIILYRIILECLNNTIKHSQAKKIILRFTLNRNKLHIAFSDNGKGFDVNKILSEGKGMGLFNIQNRIKHIGGEIKIISNISVGTDIAIYLDI